MVRIRVYAELGMILAGGGNVIRGPEQEIVIAVNDNLGL
jgi:hypothetical protein